MHRDDGFLNRLPRALRVATPGMCASWLARCLSAAMLVVALSAVEPAAAEATPVDLTSLVALRGEEGLQVSFATRFELSKPVEEALLKGIPLYFVADVEVYSPRWYWRDKRIAREQRVWRLAFQPLTRKYRVTFGSLNQSYDTLTDALNSLRRAADWLIADPHRLEEGETYYLEFNYRLDTTQLPRPMQIGVNGEADWELNVKRTLRLD